jgi:drug/metabolite transporter (DMT)-like permease
MAGPGRSIAHLGYVVMTIAAESVRERWETWVVLTTGVVIASFSAIFTRYATEANALVVSFYRCAAAALILLPFGHRRTRALPASLLIAPFAGGVFLALHFATWITSLYLTSVASAVLLVATSPVFVAVASWLLWNDRLRVWGWFGIAVSLAGTALVAGADLGGSSLSGSLLALIGGATGAGYGMAGQLARRRLGFLEYSIVAYGVAATLLGPAALVAGSEFTGFSSQTWWAIVALIVGPQLAGHTLINATLKQLHATTVTVTIMAEPVIAIVLAYLLFDEVPSALMVPGGAAILAGIYLVSRTAGQTEVIPE